MKAAIFCPGFIDPQTVYMLLPDSVSEIISAIGFDFCAEAVARKFRCCCDITSTVDEAISRADFVYVIWDGKSQRIINALKTAKKSGKRVMFSFLP